MVKSNCARPWPGFALLPSLVILVTSCRAPVEEHLPPSPKVVEAPVSNDVGDVDGIFAGKDAHAHYAMRAWLTRKDPTLSLYDPDQRNDVVAVKSESNDGPLSVNFADRPVVVAGHRPGRARIVFDDNVWDTRLYFWVANKLLQTVVTETRKFPDDRTNIREDDVGITAYPGLRVTVQPHTAKRDALGLRKVASLPQTGLVFRATVTADELGTIFVPRPEPAESDADFVYVRNMSLRATASTTGTILATFADWADATPLTTVDQGPIKTLFETRYIRAVGYIAGVGRGDMQGGNFGGVPGGIRGATKNSKRIPAGTCIWLDDNTPIGIFTKDVNRTATPSGPNRWKVAASFHWDMPATYIRKDQSGWLHCASDSVPAP